VQKSGVYEKQKAAIEAGYTYDLWIFNAKGEIVPNSKTFSKENSEECLNESEEYNEVCVDECDEEILETFFELELLEELVATDVSSNYVLEDE
jgi:hypothetical protein